MAKYNLMLFDLDGTLTDPAEGITKSVQYALNKVNIIEENRQELLKFIGPPLVESFQIFYGLEYEQAWQAVEYFREYFAKHGIFENKVYPGIESLVQRLKKEGKKLAVATSKPTVYSREILEHFKLADYFSMVAGSNLDGSRVAKAEIIQFVLESSQYPVQEVIMIGDRMHDINGARANGIDCAAVTYGYGDINELQDADYIVQSVGELANLLLD